MPGSPQRKPKKDAERFNGLRTSPAGAEEEDFESVVGPTSREDFDKLLPPGVPTLEELRAIPGSPQKGGKPGTSPEYMEALRKRRIAMGEIDPAKKGGRPRTRFTKAELTEHALERLEPQALKVLERQLRSKDERVAAAAAVKILEWKRGKPGQTIKVDSEAVHTIKYETIAFGQNNQGTIPHKEIFELLPGDIIEEEDDE